MKLNKTRAMIVATAAGIAVVAVFRNAFPHSPVEEWVYGTAAVVGIAVALVAELVLSRFLRDHPQPPDGAP